MNIRFSLILILMICAGVFSTQWLYSQNRNKTYERYVEEYKEIAIDHQRKYKIPASITLAQGLLESGAGMGTLAKKSNNHFGIKCHDWKGDKAYHDDDLPGECFRKYKHPGESYDDHSRFLTGKNRYASLFDLKITDYKGWARGLQRCGYATDKAYASKLINLIELYDLDVYDRKGGSRSSAKNTAVNNTRPIYLSSGLLYVEARKGDRLELLAKELDFKESKLRKYNELPENYELSDGEIIYLETKNKKAQKPFEIHVVQPDESMHGISQRYGIRLKNLYKMNKVEFDYVPRSGDTLKLR